MTSVYISPADNERSFKPGVTFRILVTNLQDLLRKLGIVLRSKEKPNALYTLRT